VSAFRVRFYDDADDTFVGEPVSFPALPQPGLIVIHDGGGWRVERVQVFTTHPDSVSARRGDPMLVDVMVSRADGVHHPEPVGRQGE
jgi:hypothetical protein